MELGESNTTVAGDTVTLKKEVTLGDSLTVPEGVTLTVANGTPLNTAGYTITNRGAVNVEGILNITNTAELAGNGTYTINAGSNGKLQLTGIDYIANSDAIVTADGAVEVSSNENGGYTFNVPTEVIVTVAKRNSTSGDYYHHGANDVITVEGTLVVDKNLASHGTIDVGDKGTLTISDSKKIFAASSNDTGKLIFKNSKLDGDGIIEGTDAPTKGNSINGTYNWKNTKWVKEQS